MIFTKSRHFISSIGTCLVFIYVFIFHISACPRLLSLSVSIGDFIASKIHMHIHTLVHFKPVKMYRQSAQYFGVTDMNCVLL